MCVFGQAESRNIIFLNQVQQRPEMRQDLRRMVGHFRERWPKVQARGRVHEELCRKCSVTRSFLSQHHKELVDAQLFPVVCAFAPASNPSGSFALATFSSCDSFSCDTIILDFPTHETPTHCHTSDSRKSIHIVIASFKRENGDGATTMDPSSSPC
jgi:hypothetical protein